MPEPCMCGAEDCTRCYPQRFHRCHRHGYYSNELDECPRCEAMDVEGD